MSFFENALHLQAGDPQFQAMFKTTIQSETPWGLHACGRLDEK
jgi:hypothetical protein